MNIQAASSEKPKDEGAQVGPYIRVKGLSVSLTPEGERVSKYFSRIIHNIGVVVGNIFQVFNGMVRSTDPGVSWSKSVFMFLDRARIFAFGFVPLGIYKIVSLSKGNEPHEAKVAKIASTVSDIFHSAIMGIWGICAWMGKLAQSMPWLSPLLGVGCMFRIVEIAHSNWERGRIGHIKEQLDAKWKEEPYRYNFGEEGFKDLLSSYSDNELMEHFLIPESQIKKVREDAKELVENDSNGNEKVYKFLKEKLEIKEKQIKLDVISSTVSFIAGALLLATLLTPVGPATAAVMGIAYGLFVVSGSIGLVHWKKNWDAEGMELPKPVSKPVELGEIEKKAESG